MLFFFLSFVSALQAEDLCAIEQMEGLPNDLSTPAGKAALKAQVLGADGPLGLTNGRAGVETSRRNANALVVNAGRGKLDPDAPQASASPAAPRPGVHQPQQVSMLRGAAKTAERPRIYPMSIRALGFLGLIRVHNEDGGSGMSFTPIYTGLLDSARDAILGRLLHMPEGRAKPAPAPRPVGGNGNGLVYVPLPDRQLLPPEDEAVLGLPAQVWATGLMLPAADAARLAELHRSVSGLSRFVIMTRLLHSAAADGLSSSSSSGEADADAASNALPPPAPLWLHAASQLAYALDGYKALYSLPAGAPVLKYSEDKALSLSDKGKWSERRLRVWAHGLTFDDDAARIPQPDAQFKRLLTHSGTEALLLPAPRPVPSIQDAALPSVAARHAEGRLCGVVASGSNARRRAMEDTYMTGFYGEQDAWAAFDKVKAKAPAAGAGQAPAAQGQQAQAQAYDYAPDGAQLVPRPTDHTR